MTEFTAFTIRMPVGEYHALRSLAKLKGATIAEEARSIMHEGLAARLDPEQIERGMDQRLQFLLDAAARIRAQHPEAEAGASK